jgi:glycosyltransferase involved in cell wall biosynthesis
MSDQHYRVLAVASHPVQYASPIFRRLAARADLDLHVAYCSMRGAEAAHDPDFGATVQWDVPLLDGYAWTHVPNRGSGADSFFGLRNPGLWKLIRDGNYDAVLSFTGYICATFWIALLAAKISNAAFLFGTDATTLAPRDARAWKSTLKKILWPRLFGLADQVIVPSSGSRELMLSLGLPGDRVTLTPYCVDNDWWMQQSASIDRQAVRASWSASADDAVILFCAKLQPWKRPLDLLRAFARAELSDALLVFAGDGPLRPQLEAEAAALQIADRVRFLGFVNQSQLPAVYTAVDLMVLPSEYEPFAVVVNEAMCCGCPVIASDRVGAARDLVAPVHPDFIYHCGSIEALSATLKTALRDRVLLEQRRRAVVAQIQTWSPAQNIAATIEAIRTGAARLKAPGGRSVPDPNAAHTASAASQKLHE